MNFFNFILLTLAYSEFYFFLPFLWFFFLQWCFFFKTNFFTIKILNTKKDIFHQNNVNKKLHFNVYLQWVLVNLATLIFTLFFFRGTSGVFFWNHILLNNFNFSILFSILVLNFFFFKFSYLLQYTKVTYSTDFFFALLNLMIFLSFIFVANTIFTFFFVLEVNSTIIFYKFIVSRVWYKSNWNLDKNETFNKKLSHNYLNLLFFQYWTTFFSSTLFLFCLMNFIYLFGTTEFCIFNILVHFQNIHQLSLNNIYFVLIVSIFLVSFFLKIGFAPLQLFKIEMYKGLPFISIFFYTTFYFLVYFIFFSIMLFIHFNQLSSYFYTILLLFVVFGIFFVISLIFDINALKAFFAYSTLINSILFLSLISNGLNIF